MKLSWSRQTLQILSATAAALLASLALRAVAEDAPTPPQPPLVHLGLELPLRAGEHVLATANGECSVVVFAPHEELYARHAAFWSHADWDGECRFGLAHGDGSITGTDGSWSIQTAMLYGLDINPDEATTTRIGEDGKISWESASGVLHFFSGPAFSDARSKRYVIHLGKGAPGELELGELGADWYGTDYLERHTFGKDGRQMTMSISSWDVATYCGLGLPPEFKDHEKELKKACKKDRDKLVLFRRDGPGAEPWASRPITWLKSCPVNKITGYSDCQKLIRTAIGKEVDQLETLLTEGDEAARAAARQEIIDRYAPLEETYAALAPAKEETPPAGEKEAVPVSVLD